MARKEMNKPRIRRVPVDARALVTEDFKELTSGTGAATRAEGAIVRLKPGPDVPDDVVEAARHRWLDAGAARVVVVPASKGKVLPEEAAARAQAPSRTVREVVGALVDESNTGDRDALRGLVERTMAEEGL